LEAHLRRLLLLVRRIPRWGKAVIVVFGVLVLASTFTPSPEPDHFRIELEARGASPPGLSTRALDFGSVDTSQPVQRSFTVTNTSRDDIFVNLTLESAPPFGIRVDWLVNNEAPPMFVPSGSSVPVVVTIFRTGRESLGMQTYRIAVSATRAQ
jgi:hypothetical protein